MGGEKTRSMEWQEGLISKVSGSFCVNWMSIYTEGELESFAYVNRFLLFSELTMRLCAFVGIRFQFHAENTSPVQHFNRVYMYDVYVTC